MPKCYLKSEQRMGRGECQGRLSLELPNLRVPRRKIGAIIGRCSFLKFSPKCYVLLGLQEAGESR